MTEEFKIRFQLMESKNNKIYDHFDVGIPEHVTGVISSKSETPYLVAHKFFEDIKYVMRNWVLSTE